MQKRTITFYYRLFGPKNRDVTVADVVNDYTFCVMVQSSAAAASSSNSAPNTDQRLIWINGNLVPRSEAKVSVFDHGFLYGDGVFEGIRIYNKRIFKLRSHLVRLMESAERIHLDPKLSIDEIEELTRKTVAANNLQDGYIRLILSRGEGTLGLNPFSCPEPGVICIADSIRLYPEEMYRDGMKVIIAERPRIPVECLDPSVKSLNYLNNILAKCEALRQGLYEAIMLNTKGEVAEGTGDNIFVVKDGVISTPAPDAGFLLGITRQFVIDTVAPACQCSVLERTLHLEDLYDADEIFLTGPAAEVIGASKIGDRIIGNGKVGPITQKFTKTFREMVAQDAPED